MKNNEKVELLNTYLKNNFVPVLIQGLDTNIFEDAVILNSDIPNSELNGHYDETNFVPPIWFNKIMDKKDEKINLLVIKDIDKISKEEQMKFYELLKYRKISVFDLPTNCVIIIPCLKVKEGMLNENIYSLVAHI